MQCDAFSKCLSVIHRDLMRTHMDTYRTFAIRANIPTKKVCKTNLEQTVRVGKTGYCRIKRVGNDVLCSKTSGPRFIL